MKPFAAALPLAVFLPTIAFAQDEHRLPDASKTPGHATYHTAAKVCAIKSTKDERNVPEEVKAEIYSDYGAAKCADYCSGPQGCEIDHLISLELGGANTTDNLWPQPYDGEWNAHDKRTFAKSPTGQKLSVTLLPQNSGKPPFELGRTDALPICRVTGVMSIVSRGYPRI